jgi:DNA-binding winged helix-turn-helix (wHTH) protein/tetratricopeptide (TPR) repeat protein
MPARQTCYQFGVFRTDVESGRLLRQGKLVRLQEQPFQVLVALLERPGDVVTRDELRNRLWPGDTFVEFDKSLGVALAKLRAALGDDAANPRFIETVPRRGYRFIAPVARSAADRATVTEPAIATPSIVSAAPRLAASAPVPLGRRERSTAAWLLVALAASVVAVAAVLYWRGRASTSVASTQTLVVAEFGNTTGDTAFDGSLRRATIVALRQSPFLNVLSDDAIGDALQDLGRPPGGVLSSALARDVCRHRRASAVIDGSVARPDDHTYVTVVSASRCADGTPLARETRTFARKEDVLPGLGRQLERVRAMLGESRATLTSYDIPLEVATTESIDALRAYQLGLDLRARADNQHAIPALQTAVSIDPQFAIAYAQLGSAYSNQANTAAATPYFRKAFELRDRATEPERLYITGRYFDIVTRELEKASQTYKLWTRIYPNDWLAFNALANDANLLGRYDVALEAANRSVALNPRHPFGRTNLMTALVALHRFDEARQTAAQILERNPNSTAAHLTRYAIAVFEGDAAAATREVAWGAEHPDDAGMPYAKAEWAAAHGEMAASARLFREVARLDRAAGNDEGAADALAWSAEIAALVGNSDTARQDAAAALELSRRELTTGITALVAAQTGHTQEAKEKLNELGRDRPLSTFTMGVYAPMLRGAIATAEGAAAPAITDAMAPALPYELGQQAGLMPGYIRGRGYLAARAPDLAVTEFQKIIDHVGVDPVSPFYSLAYVELARAEAALGRRDDSRKAYATFLDLWKGADRDVPILREALREYATVQ